MDHDAPYHTTTELPDSSDFYYNIYYREKVDNIHAFVHLNSI
jgi:hypothetical protein